MKKNFSALATVIFAVLIFALPLTCHAENDLPHVYDGASVLDNNEAAELSERLKEISDRYNVDVAVVIQSELLRDTAEASADDIFDYNSYGRGENNDGILLYISMNPREYHYTTHAYAMEAFNEKGLAYLDGQVLPYLKSNDFYGAISTYADTCDELLEAAANGHPYNKKPASTVAAAYIIAVIAAVAIAAVMTFIKTGKMHTAKAKREANDYMKPGSMDVRVARDIFLYTQIHKREKPQSNGGSGGHTSSSGETHGGRGGSF